VSPRPPDFLIGGTPRSGTTYVQRLATSLVGVAVPPETHFFVDFGPGLLGRSVFPLAGGDLRTELERYAALPTSQGLDLDVEAVVATLAGQAADVFTLFAAVVHALADGALVGEKTPDHLLWWPALASAFPELRFVAVVRDPRAVVASNLEVAWGMSSIGLLAERWASDQRRLRRAVERIGADRVLVVRFEDAVGRPDEATERLAAFLGAPPRGGADPDTGRLYHEWESWKSRVANPADVDRIDAWRTTLGRADIDLVAAVCRAGMERHGYDAALPSTRAWLAQARQGPGDQARRVRFRWARARRLRRIDALARATGPAGGVS